MTNTTRRTVRVDDPTWTRAQTRAAEEGESVSAVVVRALRRYGRPRRPPAPPGPPNVRGAVPLPLEDLT